MWAAAAAAAAAVDAAGQNSHATAAAAAGQNSHASLPSRALGCSVSTQLNFCECNLHCLGILSPYRHSSLFCA